MLDAINPVKSKRRGLTNRSGRKSNIRCSWSASRARAAQLYWAVDEASVPVTWSGRGLSLAAGGVLDAALSFAGAETMTVRVVVLVRPEMPVTT